MSAIRSLGLGAAIGCLAAPSAAAQAAKTCQLQVDNVDRQGMSSTVAGSTNYFAGGNVRLHCVGQEVRIWTDSVASYQGQVVQFIGHFRYQDQEAHVTSDFGTYYKDNERWEAQGHVVYVNRPDSSRLEGPNARYYRRIKGTRDQEEVEADQRPRLTLAAKDSAGRLAEPYRVVADRIRLRGDDQMWGGGNVTIDRSDLQARSDSVALDTGKGSAGVLLGHASLRRTVSDSFALAAKRIDLTLLKRELSAVTGRDSATLTSRELDLSGETIALRLKDRKVVQTLAWGAAQKPRALADEYQVRGDSLALDTPNEALKELRAFRGGWVGFKPDTAKGEQDWLAGDTVVATFEERPPAPGGGRKSALRRLEAKRSAHSFYRVAGSGTGARPSIAYSRADHIVLFMQSGDSLQVERVEMTGNVDGVQLEPKAAKPDTVKKDTSAVKPRKP
jgi:hypothetical protein